MWKYEVVGPRRQVFLTNIESKGGAARHATRLSRKSGKKFTVRPYRAPVRLTVRVANSCRHRYGNWRQPSDDFEVHRVCEKCGKVSFRS